MIQFVSQELGYQSYSDQPHVTARLVVAGIGLILAGLCCTCVLAFLPFAFRAASTTALTSNAAMRIGLIVTAIMVFCLTVVFIWTGVACFLGIRWVRPIVLILSVIGLALSVPSILAMVIAIMRPPANAPGPAWASLIGIAIVAIMYFGFPLAYLLMFRPTQVKHLLERLDPVPRWTDGLPVPLLGMSLVTFVLGVQLPLAPLMAPQPLLFGAPLNRLVAAVPLLFLMAAMITAAVWLYRKRLIGWWLAVGLMLLLASSNLVNVLKYGEHLYDKTLGEGMSAFASHAPMASQKAQLIGQGIYIVMMLTGAIWVKRCCLDPVQPVNQSEQATIGSPSSPL